MRVIISRRGKRFHDISKRISCVMEVEKGNPERAEAFKSFHREIAMDHNVGYLCSENRVMESDLEEIVDKMVQLGFGWHRGYYVPVSAFTYSDTFSFLMNRRHKLNKTDYMEIKEYLYNFF